MSKEALILALQIVSLVDEGPSHKIQVKTPSTLPLLGLLKTGYQFIVLIIPIAFLVSIANPVLNIANQGNDCTVLSGSNLFYCSEVKADIATCQMTYGKTILISLGGATYTKGEFSATAAAVAAADNVFRIFGPYMAGSTYLAHLASLP
ncbi:hypothetical protein BJ878DRAFT_547907 [Calycina marina]|uniref:Uncharacterized protein n=1 Tax=Calycina marina TaxID=1763456 RepID=A0A9P8CAT3_9HELO|nr:hypothetical protein BJ878DRAFT_547907 [Calycina marina]